MLKLLILVSAIFCCLQQTQTLPTRSEVTDYLARLYQGWRPQPVDEPRDWQENSEILDSNEKRNRISNVVGSKPSSTSAAESPMDVEENEEPDLLAELPGLIKELRDLLASANRASQISRPMPVNTIRNDLMVYSIPQPTTQIMRPNSRFPISTSQYQINGGMPVWSDPSQNNFVVPNGASSIPSQYNSPNLYPWADLFYQNLLTNIIRDTTTTTTTTPRPTINTRAPGLYVPWLPYPMPSQGLLPVPNGSLTRWQLVLTDPMPVRIATRRRSMTDVEENAEASRQIGDSTSGKFIEPLDVGKHDEPCPVIEGEQQNVTQQVVEMKDTSQDETKNE